MLPNQSRHLVESGEEPPGAYPFLRGSVGSDPPVASGSVPGLGGSARPDLLVASRAAPGWSGSQPGVDDVGYDDSCC